MVPIKLTLSNFMCYRADGAPQGPPCLVLDGLHVVCLSGENGAGKSALLDAITWALWGEARMADDDLIAQGQGEMSVDLEFQLGDQLYRVIRRRQRGGTGKRGGQAAGKSQLDLQVHNGEAWRPMGEIGVRETQAAINDLLRMSYQTFINAAFLLQGRADEFTARTPGERKEVLADILDLGEYEALATKAKERARGFADQLTGLQGTIEQLQRQADDLDTWRTLLAQAEAAVESLSAACDSAEAACAAAERQVADLTGKADRRRDLLREIERLRAGRAERERELAALRARIAQAEALIARGAEIRAGLASLAESRAEVERLDGLRERWQTLEDQRKELQSQLREALKDLQGRQLRAAGRRDDLKLRAGRRDELRQALADLQARLAGLAALDQERQAGADALEDTEGRLARLHELRARHAELDGKIKLRADSLIGAREEQARVLRRLDEQLRDEPRWRRDLAEAEAARARLAEDEARLATMRDDERAALDQASQMRAECGRLKQAADKLKANQKLLASGEGACPVCRSDLGPAGVERVHAHYEEELQELRAQYAAAKGQAEAADTRVGAVRSAIGDIEAALSAARSLAARAEPLAQQLAQAARWRDERAEHQRLHDDLQAQIASASFDPGLQADLAELNHEITALGDPTALAKERDALAERVRELDGRIQERGRLQGESTARQGALRELEADLAELPALEAEAAALDLQLATNDFAHEVRQAGRQVVAQIEALAYSAENHAAARERARDLRRWEDESRALAVAEEGLSRDGTILRQSEELQARDDAEIERLTRDDAVLEQELRELPRAQARAAELRAELQDARRKLNAAQSDLGEKRGYVKKAEQAAAELELRRDEERRLAERRGLFAELAEAFGKKGVQAMLIETAIPQIEDEANRLLGRMTDGQMHLSFEMQRDTKKGDTVETLEIKIADALGTRVYDAFSGGEAMRANFAVRIALSRLLARRAGARLETLVIDEGFGTLDALGRERMVEAITSVQDDFRRIIVITHIDELKDRFPVHIEVTKTPLGSMWEVR